MPSRPQPYRVSFPLTAAQVENIDTMFGTLFRATRGVTTDTTTGSNSQTFDINVVNTGVEQIFEHYATVGNVTTTETDLYSDSIPPNLLSTNGDVIYVNYGGAVIGAASSSQRIRIYVGGTLVLDTGAVAFGVTVAWSAQLMIIRASSTILRVSAEATTSLSPGTTTSAFTIVTGLNLTNAQIVKVTGTASGGSAASDQILAGSASAFTITEIATEASTSVAVAVGDLLYGSATNTVGFLPDVATGNALISGGILTAPSWGKIGLTTHVSGVLPIVNGGTNSTAVPTAGGIVFGTGTAYNITAAGTSGQVLISAGAGTPVWSTASTALAHNVLSATHSDTLAASVVRGDVVVGNATPKWSRLAIGAAARFLRSDGTDVAWAQVTLTTDVTGVLPFANGGTNNSTMVAGGVAYGVGGVSPGYGFSAAGSVGEVLISGGTGSPTWSATVTATAHNLLSTTHSDTLAASVVRGDLVVGNSTPKWSRLAVGAASRLLKSDGTDVSWAQVGLTTDVTGVLPLANGGTGADLSAGAGPFIQQASSGAVFTSGKIPAISSTYFTSLSGANLTGVSLTAGVSGILPIANGGTNSSTALSGSSIIISNGTGIIQGAAGTATTLLHGNASGAPTYSAASLTADVSGILPFANGGTNNNTMVAGAVAYGLGGVSPAYGFTAAGTTGQALVSGGTGSPTWSNTPLVGARGRATAQTAAVGTVVTYTVGAADSSFFVSANILVTASTTHNFRVDVTYTDEANTAQTQQIWFAYFAGVSAATTITIADAATTQPYAGFPLQIRCKASSTINIATVGTFTSVTYNVEGAIQQVA